MTRKWQDLVWPIDDDNAFGLGPSNEQFHSLMQISAVSMVGEADLSYIVGPPSYKLVYKLHYYSYKLEIS